MRILGLDIGTKRIGVSLSDESGTLAQGKEVITRRSNLEVFKRIKELVNEYNVEKIVAGLPLNMDGSLGKKAQEVKSFTKKLEEEVSVAVLLWDERLSTVEAQGVLLEADVTRGKRKKVIDKIAAQLILQSYLDSRRKE